MATLADAADNIWASTVGAGMPLEDREDGRAQVVGRRRVRYRGVLWNSRVTPSPPPVWE